MSFPKAVFRNKRNADMSFEGMEENVTAFEQGEGIEASFAPGSVAPGFGEEEKVMPTVIQTDIKQIKSSSTMNKVLMAVLAGALIFGLFYAMKDSFKSVKA